MTEPWLPPPEPPLLPAGTVSALADHCQAMALHLLRELPQTSESGAQTLDNLLAAARAHLAAAQVLRESYAVNLWKYE